MNKSNRLFCLILYLFLVAWCLVLASPLGAQENNNPDPEALLKVLVEGAASLERDIATGKTDAEALEQRVKQEEVNLHNLRARIATLKATLAAGELQLKQAQEAFFQIGESLVAFRSIPALFEIVLQTIHNGRHVVIHDTWIQRQPCIKNSATHSFRIITDHMMGDHSTRR